jgi:glycosyltransferase involved in cell wall biosynthesis
MNASRRRQAERRVTPCPVTPPNVPSRDKQRSVRGSMSERKAGDLGVVLVVPKAGSEVAEHFAHTFRLAEHIRRYTRTAVIVERLSGTRPTTHPAVEVRIQRYADRGFVLRASELLWLAASLRRKGLRSFFVRTSQTAAVPLIVLRRLFGGRVLYWSCGELKKSRLRDIGVRAALRGEIPMRLAFRWADVVVTGTESLAAHYSETYRIPRQRMAVIPNDIDLQWFKPATETEHREARAEFDLGVGEQLLLSVHRLSPVRRTLFYIPSVLEAIADSHPNVRFILAGGGPEEADVRAALQRSRLNGQVKMLGAVPHDRIRRLYAAADVFMMPSYTEGFPRVLLEAMAMRVPIASTDVGGVREILPALYESRLANRDQPLELVSAVSELLRDPTMARSLADEGARWVRRFDAPSVARKIAALASQ